MHGLTKRGDRPLVAYLRENWGGLFGPAHRLHRVISRGWNGLSCHTNQPWDWMN